MRRVILALCCVLSVGTAQARRSVTRAFPPSRASLIAQNTEIDRLGLPRIKNDRELQELVKSGELVPICSSVRVSASLPFNRRYVRSWVNDFLQGIGAAYFAEFGQRLQVNSAVRTVQVQRSLTHWNANAAPAHGETASSHLAGLTVDIARRGLTKKQIAWVQQYLLGLGDAVIVEEELRQPCFHICIRGPHDKETLHRIS